MAAAFLAPHQLSFPSQHSSVSSVPLSMNEITKMSGMDWIYSSSTSSLSPGVPPAIGETIYLITGANRGLPLFYPYSGVA
jgi:hypothetical protein